MLSYIVPLKNRFWRHLKFIILKPQRYLVQRLYQLQLRPRYAISEIDGKKMQVKMIEYGMSFCLSFDELHKYLNIISELSHRDVLIFGFLLSWHGSLKEIQIGYPEKFKQGLSLILESEDRKGRFNIFDVNTRRHETTSFAMLLQNPGMIKRMGYDDLFQIGMIAGKHKENYILVQRLVASQVLQNW